MKVNRKGYYATNFYYGGKLHTHVIHYVVAMAYLGPRPEGHEIDHINNDRQDNRPTNLQYLTKSANNQKAWDAGNRNISGDRNPNSFYRRGLRNVQRLSREGVGEPS